MQTKPKSNSVVTHAQGEDGALIFRVKDVGELRFDIAKCSEATRKRAELHGWIQRISDAAAQSRDTKTGKPAEPREKLSAMKRLVDWYETGTVDWKMSGGERTAPGSAEKALLVRCLREIYTERTEEDLRAWVEKRSAAERAALLASEKIKQWAELFRAEQGSGVDAEELLGELSDEDEGPEA